jgi:hypothetical protein
VLVEQEVHVCDGAMGHCRMAVAQTVHRLCDALQSFVQSKSLAEALLLALMPEQARMHACIYNIGLTKERRVCPVMSGRFSPAKDQIASACKPLLAVNTCE